jgi:hypothetical protein
MYLGGFTNRSLEWYSRNRGRQSSLYVAEFVTAAQIVHGYYNSASCCIQTLLPLNFTVFNATFCTSVLH